MLPTIRARLRAGAQAKEIGPATSAQLAGPPSVPPPGALLTPPEVAERLRVALKTLEDWRRRGDGPRFIRLGRACVRYRTEEIEAFLAARTLRHTAEG